jgi:hypothetical protein
VVAKYAAQGKRAAVVNLDENSATLYRNLSGRFGPS